jgi:hypothetical protein
MVRDGSISRNWLAVVTLVGLAGAVAAGQGSAGDQALQYLRENRQAFGLTGSDVNDVVVSSTVVSSHNGVTHVYLQQRYRGIEVWNGILNVALGADGAASSTGHRFVTNLASSAGGQQPRRAAETAAADAAGHLRRSATSAFVVLARRGGAAEAVTISDGGIAERPIEGRLVWVPTDTAVRLAWDLRID